MLRTEGGALAEQVLIGDNRYYNVLLTAHAIIMIFLFIMPSLVSGLANL
jgi:heme/copper-type cytochrome/quinol oxidase subunit 1